MQKKTFTIGGRSVGLVLPIALCDLVGLEPGDMLELTADTVNKTITLKVAEK
jgi:bifunctional DNA-binding transcriptional regulator/antitoxin component of YhaV-PrlF toxin-antitoxin module